MPSSRITPSVRARKARPTRDAGGGGLRAAAARVRWAGRIVSVAFLIGLTFVLPAQPAAAHAGLLDTEPTSGAVYDLDSQPDSVRLVFNESVSNPGNGIVVLNSAGEPVDVGDEQIENGVVFQALGELREDVYTVVYHLVSADGHPIRGAYVFTYGTPNAGTDEAASALVRERESENTNAAVLSGVIAAGENVFVLIAAGAAAAWAVFRLRDRRTRIIAASFAIGAGLFAAAGVLVRVIETGADVFSERSTVAGLVRVACAAALTAVAIGTKDREVGPAPALGAAGIMLATYAAVGHGFNHGNIAVNAMLLTVHLIAGAVWIGAAPVVAVALTSRSGEVNGTNGDGSHDAYLTAVMRRFSMVATVALPSVVVAGGVLAAVYTGLEPGGTYAAVLLVKIGLVGILSVLGLRARRALQQSRPVSTLRRTMWIEAGAVIFVAAISAVLTTTAPSAAGHGDHRDHVEHSGEHSGVNTQNIACEVELGGRTISLTWDGTGPGQASVHLYATGGEGGEMQLLAAHERLSGSALQYDLTRYNAVHWMGPIDLPFGGTWTLTLRERPDRFTVVEGSCELSVPG